MGSVEDLAVRLGCEADQRMGGGVDAGQMVEGDLGVELGGFQTAMAQQGLDDPDVGAALEHVGGAGVAEQVAGAGFFDLGLLEQAF